jgi:hypothetical protein
MGVDTTNKRVDRVTKLMGAILRVLVHRAMLSLGLGAQMKPMGAFLRLFAMLLRARWSTLALRLMGAFFYGAGHEVRWIHVNERVLG